MGMCKGCQKVFPSQEINDQGFCSTCVESPERMIKAQEALVSTTKFATLKSPEGKEQQVSLGSSMLVFVLSIIFTIIVPLYRRDWKFAGMIILMFVLFGAILGIAGVSTKIITLLGWVLSFSLWTYMGLKYNDLYAKNLLKKGYVPATDFDHKVLQFRGIIA